MKQGFNSDQEMKDAQENFVRFFEEHDKRRNTNFKKTFPEFASYFDEWAFVNV